MDGLNNIFESKKERNDFYIAIVVILLFLWFFWTWLSKTAADVILPTVPETELAVVAAEVDSDGDGILDINDNCPDLAGIAANDGCPADIDGDGIYDSEDECPKYKGTLANAGCPADTDGDGIHDGIDKCVELAGVESNFGCPADSDGDGVYDVNDKCPSLAGVAANNGCPEVKIAEEDKVLLAAAMKSVEFETGKATLKGTSSSVLTSIGQTLAKYPDYKLTISGHTDNTGDPAKNMQLSKDRAKACYDFLVGMGIKKYRLSHTGYGQRSPIADNSTPDGRQTNRRVEFDLNY